MTRFSTTLRTALPLVALAFAVSGCAVVDRLKPGGAAEATPAAMPAPAPGDETPTVDDTETPDGADAAPAGPAAGPGGKIGTTVASLGDPAQGGMWLETPLVTATAAGQVAYEGRTADVELRPIPGPATAGSRMSLAAFQALGAPITGLPTIEVRRK